MIYLSRPQFWVPEERLDNAAVLARVRARYRGDEAAWPAIQGGLELILQACRAEFRYREPPEAPVRNGTAAARVARRLLAREGIDPTAVDMLIHGGISKDYLEPATAMEVCAKLGVVQPRAMDITSACAGQAIALATAWAWMLASPQIETAVVTASEILSDAHCWDIQSPDDVAQHGAGITLSDAASAWVLRRRPLRGGSLRVVTAEIISRPEHWQLSVSPLGGRFVAHASELLRVGNELPMALQEMLERHDWRREDVTQFFLHPGGHAIHERMVASCGLPPASALEVHALYGNTGSCGVAGTAWRWFELNTPAEGQRFVILSGGAGMSAACLLLEWTSEGAA